MPQVHNKTFAHEGTGVRFLASISLSEGGMKTVRMKNHVVRNLQNLRTHRLEKMVSKSDRTKHQQRLKLKQSLRRMVAYRQVVNERAVVRKSNYQQSLNWNYTEDGMKTDINRVLYDTDPVTIQKRKERLTVEQNRLRYQEILNKSKENLSTIIQLSRNIHPVSNSFTREDKIITAKTTTSTEDKFTGPSLSVLKSSGTTFPPIAIVPEGTGMATTSSVKNKTPSKSRTSQFAEKHFEGSFHILTSHKKPSYKLPPIQVKRSVFT